MRSIFYQINSYIAAKNKNHAICNCNCPAFPYWISYFLKYFSMFFQIPCNAYPPTFRWKIVGSMAVKNLQLKQKVGLWKQVQEELFCDFLLIFPQKYAASVRKSLTNRRPGCLSAQCLVICRNSFRNSSKSVLLDGKHLRTRDLEKSPNWAQDFYWIEPGCLISMPGKFSWNRSNCQ